jgi:hypothetical protein
VDEGPNPGGDADRREVQQLLGQYDAPAYFRRARGVQNALEHLLARCRRQREEWLPMVRLRLATLRDLAGDWPALAAWLDDGQRRTLADLHAELRPTLRVPLGPTASRRALRRALRELIASIRRFNARWERYLAEVDLAPLNVLRDGYNRYYVLEKECAVRSAVLARVNFQPLPPFTHADLAGLVPALVVPGMRE